MNRTAQLPKIFSALRVTAAVLAHLHSLLPQAYSADRKLNVDPIILSFGKVQVGTVSAPKAIKLSNRCGLL